MTIEGCAAGPFGIAAVLGLLLGVGWFALYLLSWVWAWSWAWIDDSKAPRANPLIGAVMRSMGWGDGDWLYIYKKQGKGSDGERAFFFPLISLLFGPLLAVLAVKLYAVTLTFVTLYLLARLARFARRHKKLFDKHIADPDAHK